MIMSTVAMRSSRTLLGGALYRVTGDWPLAVAGTGTAWCSVVVVGQLVLVDVIKLCVVAAAAVVVDGVCGVPAWKLVVANIVVVAVVAVIASCNLFVPLEDCDAGKKLDRVELRSPSPGGAAPELEVLK